MELPKCIQTTNLVLYFQILIFLVFFNLKFYIEQ
jgi:hypothetical protein